MPPSRNPEARPVSGGRVYVLERRQQLELPVQLAFEFHAQARNLAVITPPWIGFDAITPGPIDMRPGALIDYRMKLFVKRDLKRIFDYRERTLAEQLAPESAGT